MEGDFSQEVKNTEEGDIFSQSGIIFRDGERKFLSIPSELVRKLVVGGKMGRDAINKLHANVFDGAHIMWGQREEDFYTIELGYESTMEQIQNLVNEIESSSSNSK
jgi:hypothetical protein